MTYTVDSSTSDASAQGDGSRKVMNIWAVKNNTYYRITYAAQASEFDKYLEPVEKMIGSVKILEAPAPVLMVADANLHARSTTNVTAGAATVKP